MIETRFDKRRGCGWRKEGGLYLVAPPGGIGCGRFPLRLDVCPTCSGGIKPTRGFTWIDPGPLFATAVCRWPDATPLIPGGIVVGKMCRDCSPHPRDVGRAGLVWVGGVHYRAPSDFLRESRELGISRRIPHVPNDFKIGETWVMLGHRSALLEICRNCDGTGIVGPPASSISDPCPQCVDGSRELPGIFSMFKPTAIEYVVTGKESTEDLERLEKRGIVPVKVERIEDADAGLLEAEIRIDAVQDLGEVT